MTKFRDRFIDTQTFFKTTFFGKVLISYLSWFGNKLCFGCIKLGSKIKFDLLREEKKISRLLQLQRPGTLQPLFLLLGRKPPDEQKSHFMESAILRFRPFHEESLLELNNQPVASRHHMAQTGFPQGLEIFEHFWGHHPFSQLFPPPDHLLPQRKDLLEREARSSARNCSSLSLFFSFLCLPVSLCSTLMIVFLDLCSQP